MAERRTTVDGLADVIMDGLKEYADLATDTVKDAVKDVSKTVKKDSSVPPSAVRAFTFSRKDIKTDWP